jgi:shikimate kinase / 3-dehydroquinate synthase
VKAEDILVATQLDKKVVGKRIRWVMPCKLGEVTMMSLPAELVQRVIMAFFAE